MRVLFACSEAYPLAKTGGLADVAAALPLALDAAGTDVRIILPGYEQALAAAANKVVQATCEDVDGAPVQLVSARMPDTGLPIWLVDCPSLFRRMGGLDLPGSAYTPDGIRYSDRLTTVSPTYFTCVLLPNYDMGLAKALIAESDVWLNTPLPPLEASGTSGMKAAMNGVLNLSVLDGWWIEGCIEGVGHRFRRGRRIASARCPRPVREAVDCRAPTLLHCYRPIAVDNAGGDWQHRLLFQQPANDATICNRRPFALMLHHIRLDQRKTAFP